MWYNAGTITVAAGSVDVVGNGTAFVGNADTSHALIAPDGRIYEIAQVVSATALKLVRPYAGGGAANVVYDILPTQENLAGLAIRLDTLLATFRDMRDTIGRGMVPDGTVATPGLRFVSDQDTGIRRNAENAIALVTGGLDALTASPEGAVIRGSLRVAGFGNGTSGDGIIFARSTGGNAYGIYPNANDLIVRSITGGTDIAAFTFGGNVGIGTTSPTSKFEVAAAGEFYTSWRNTASGVVGSTQTGVNAFTIYTSSNHALRFGTNNSLDRMTLDAAGNLLVGVTSGPCHTIARGGSQGDQILNVTGTGQGSTTFFSGSGNAINASAACMKINRNTDTNRSVAAAGTINASGADYAEYMLKAAGCGLIAKGDVCGIDRDGWLTKTWADAVSFGIKSTDPSLVGGDTWGAEVGPQPEQPGAEPVEPSPPAPPAEGADDATIAAWRDAMVVHTAQVASYQTARAEWQQATDAYAKALLVWEASHEKARQCVDRISFCGQVPVNVDAETLAACEAALADGVAVYLVAVARGAGIGVVAVREQDMTLPQYMRRVGKVWAIRDGRPWVDVQHG